MPREYSLGLALYDLAPPLVFFLGAWFLVRFTWRERGPLCGSLMTAGTALVFLAGLLKACHKVLLTASGGTTDVVLMSEAQFPLMAPGFLLMTAAAALVLRQGKGSVGGLAPAIATWKMPLMSVMVIGSLASMGILAAASFRGRATAAGALFAIAAVMMLAMGGMGTGEMTVARQWLAQSVNTVAQGTFAAGTILLARSARRRGTQGGDTVRNRGR